MPSKLDYLSSKYTSQPKKEKKKNKRKKRSKDEEDEDDYLLPAPPIDRDEEEDDANENEDGPMVVADPILSSNTNGPSRNDEALSFDEMRRLNRRRGRHDSFSSDDDEDPRKVRTRAARQRHDSSESEDSNSKTTRKRHDSSSEDNEEATPKRKRHDSSSSSSDEDGNKPTMSSGHAAGLQTGSDFAKKESKIQSKRQGEAQEMVDKYGIGETVYREKSSNSKSNKQNLTETERIHWITGRAQLEQAERAKQEMERIRESSFARGSDDAELEELRKREIRPDDPMAQYALQHSTATTKTENRRPRPVYKGPPAKPNRFRIPPGHRWDAVDRSNGFEDRLMAQQASVHHKRQREYQQSALDM